MQKESNCEAYEIIFLDKHQKNIYATLGCSSNPILVSKTTKIQFLVVLELLIPTTASNLVHFSCLDQITVPSNNIFPLLFQEMNPTGIECSFFQIENEISNI